MDKTKIKDFLDKLPSGACVGVAAKNLTTNKSFIYQSGTSFGTASVIKIAIAITLFKKAEKGELDVYKNVPLLEKDIFDIGFDDCGVLRYFQKNTQISLYNACVLMLSMSDNTATNFLLRFVPCSDINEFLKQEKFENTCITLDKLEKDLIDEDEDNYVGKSSPSETLELVEGLLNKKYLSAEFSEAILKIMSAQQINHKIPRILPTIRNNTSETSEIVNISSKTGELSIAQIDNDVALITTQDGQQIIITIYTQGIPNKVEGRRVACTDSASACFIAELSLKIYNYLK